MNYMVDFYVNSVKYGYMTIEQVPDRYREEVSESLEREQPIG